jgi:hypothetical protein
MYVLQQRRFHHVTIKPDDVSLGHVRRSTAINRLRLNGQGFIDVSEILVYVAGAEAEKKATGRYDHRGAHEDWEQALLLAAGMDDQNTGGDPNAPLPQAIVRGARAQAREILDAYWPLVSVIARSLLSRETLRRSDVIALRTPDLFQRCLKRVHKRFMTRQRHLRRQFGLRKSRR